MQDEGHHTLATDEQDIPPYNQENMMQYMNGADFRNRQLMEQARNDILKDR